MVTSKTSAVGATSITTFSDAYGRSSLLVGSPMGLHHFNVREATSSTAMGRIISSYSILRQPHTIRAVQNQDQITVWSLTQAGELGYMKTSQANFLQGTAGITASLLPPGQVNGFSASVSVPATGKISQIVVTNDTAGNLSVFLQPSDTQLWTTQPLYSASTSSVMEVDCYLTTIQAHDSTGKALQGGFATISMSAQTNAIVSGKNMTLYADSTDYSLDATGELAITIPTQGIAAPAITVSSLKSSGDTSMSFQPVTFYPMAKPLNSLRQLVMSNGLASAKTQAGIALIGPSTAAEDLQTATDAIFNMTTVANNLRTGMVNVPGPATPKNTTPVEEAWNWVKKEAKSASSWFVTQIGLLRPTHFVEIHSHTYRGGLGPLR